MPGVALLHGWPSVLFGVRGRPVADGRGSHAGRRAMASIHYIAARGRPDDWR